MGLRPKFLLILILFSVVPLLGVFLINQKLFDKLGGEIFQIAKVLLLQTAAKELQESADNYAHNINREISYIEKHVESCQGEIEKVILRSETSSSENAGPRFHDITAQEVAILFQKLRYFRNDLVSLALFSQDGFAIKYPDTVGTVEAGTKVNLLEAGAASSPHKPVWILPGTHSLNTPGRSNITIVLPLHYPDGSWFGSLVAEFDIMQLLETVRPSSQWTPYMRSLLLRVDSASNPNTVPSLVIGARNPLSGHNTWVADSPYLLSRELDTEGGVKLLLEGKKYGKQGYMSLPYGGEVSLLSYSKTDIELGILNILPEREVIYRIARHPGRLSKWLNLDSYILLSVVVLIMVIIAAYRSRRMLAPFLSMVSAFDRLAAGDFSTKLEFTTRDERQMVADAFNKMTLQLKEGMRMRQGLGVAEEVQHNFFPEVDPSISGLDIAATMSYCEETGGDYVDVLKGKDGKICVVVGDVTGHGIGAALLMTTVRGLIRGRYDIDTDLPQLITSVNYKLTEDMGDSGRFVTLFAIEINPAARVLKWVRAGHDPGWLFCNIDNSFTSLVGPGVALGVDSEFTYSGNYRDQLDPGNVIVIGTDGIWEATNTADQQFGKDRLEQIVSENLHRSATEISDSLIAAVNQFRGDQNQDDDISLVVIKVPE